MSTRGVDEGSSNSYAPAAISTNNMLQVVTDHVSLEPERTKLYPERRIEKVPLTMRKDVKTEGYFDPKVVSIGPYHHGKEELQIGERVKHIIAQLYILPSGREMGEFRTSIREIVDVARSYYDLEGSTKEYSDEEFAEIMLLDGLFVLAYLERSDECYKDGTIQKELAKHLGNHAIFFLEADITEMLENQLPFQVLELLMGLKTRGSSTFAQLLDKYMGMDEFEKSRDSLDRTGTHDHRKQLLHFPEYLWFDRNKWLQSIPAETSDEDSFWELFYSFRSISELKAKGIHARPGSPDIDSQRDIKFRSYFFFGVLEIPPLMLNPHFIIQNANQIAYELTPNNRTNEATMAYINFLKALINSAEDVRELRLKHILLSPCTSDEEVVHMINSIPTIFEEDFGIYAKVKRSIQNHCDNKVKTWIAELIHTYFKSPWAFITLLAATAFIIMTFLQTYFTINSRS